MKQATATKLGTYSTYSTRSSIHFLVRWSNFWKATQKIFRRLSVQPGLRGSNDIRVGRKMANFQLFFQFREKLLVRRGQIRRIRWAIMTTRRITGGKITTFKLGHQVFDVTYDGACSPNVSVTMAWISFGALPCRKRKNLDGSPRLDVVEIARVTWHASFKPL